MFNLYTKFKSYKNKYYIYNKLNYKQITIEKKLREFHSFILLNHIIIHCLKFPTAAGRRTRNLRWLMLH